MSPRIFQTIREERAVAGGRRISLDFRVDDEFRVPALLLLPPGSERTPAALLLHGYTSQKERMSDSIGRALLAHGVASMAIDLPLHGERSDVRLHESARNPLELVRQWRLALREAALALRYLAARPDVDGTRLGIVGYSLGSFLGITVAAKDTAVRAVVLASGGDLPDELPYAKLIRTVVDPLRAARKLEGRPLLLVHGKRDRTVLPEQAQRLFDAAQEPKEIRWWDAGHWLPAPAIDDAAIWLGERLAQRSAPGREHRDERRSVS